MQFPRQKHQTLKYNKIRILSKWTTGFRHLLDKTYSTSDYEFAIDAFRTTAH